MILKLCRAYHKFRFVSRVRNVETLQIIYIAYIQSIMNYEIITVFQ